MPRTLKEWEADLVKRMPRVRLLSELGLNYADMLEIANLIKQENQSHTKISKTTKYKNFVEEFPYTFVAFLAAFAAQNTERDFWNALAELLNVNSGDLNNAKWGSQFNDILKENHKPTFENLGYKYVGNIRIHGGIPSYSLGDFFANMLLPAIEKPEYIELKGKELLDALMRRSVVQLFTDSTIRNFFDNSDETGLEFLESSCQVARTYRSIRQIPSDHTLPEYVVQKLISFLEHREDEKHGFRRPRIKFNPDGEGLLLEIPEQPLSVLDARGYQVRWQVHQNKKLVREEKSRITRIGRDILTVAQTISLGYLLEPFQVTFSLPTENGEFRQVREWLFEIRSPDTPDLLVFRYEDGSLLRWSQALPAQNLLLVRPKDISLQFDGEARVIYAPDLLAEGWDNWRAEDISLENAWSLSLLKAGEIVSVIPIQKQLELPRLVGEAFSPNLDTKPLYIGTPPTLRIPLRPGVTAGDELKRWHVEINSVWEAEPSLRQSFKLSEKNESIVTDDSALEFDLAAILGREPKGTYALRVRGPLETDVELPFRVWPSLLVKDLPDFILPSKEQKTIINFILPPRSSLEVRAGNVGVHVTGQYGRYAVELDEIASRLDLNLVWPQEDYSIHVPVSLPIPRLEWRYVVGEESELEWTSHPIRRPVDAYLQSIQTTALLLRMPGIDKHSKYLVLRLVDPENSSRTLQEFHAQISPLGSNYIRFVLNAKDTLLHHSDMSEFQFQLFIPAADGTYHPVTLLSFTRGINVSNVRIVNTDESQYLFWDEPTPLRKRRVFIHSMWKPWAPTWNVKIPDDARGKVDLFVAAEGGLPPSWYEVHFYVAPSWEKDITAAPDHSTYVVETISPDDQIGWLDKHLQKHPEQSFVNHFERACLYATIGNTHIRDQEIQFCYDHIDQAKLKDLFAFHEWLDKYESNTMRAVRMKMYNPEHLQHLFVNYKPGDEFRRKYQKYITETRIKPESAILLVENENEPSVIFHALRELIKRRDEHLLGVLALLLEEGRLSDTDAIGLLRLEEEHYLSELDSSEPTNINLRLLSGLLKDKDELLGSLSNDKILSLAKAEKDPQTIKKYLGLLARREDIHGLEFIMELFQKSHLLGHEVTDLLGENPKFSTQVLSNAPQTHAHLIQLLEITRKYPIETGHVAVGMFIQTPAGWGRIDAIEDSNTTKINIVSKEETKVKYHVTLYPDTDNQIKAILDIEEEKLYLPNSERFFQCGICKFISLDQNYILREHTRNKHGGVGASVVPNLSRLNIRGELQFSQSQPTVLRGTHGNTSA